MAIAMIFCKDLILQLLQNTVTEAILIVQIHRISHTKTSLEAKGNQDPSAA